MLLAFCLRSRIYENIIDKDNYKLVQEGTKNPVHQIHEYHGSISQPKWHDQKLERFISNQEKRLWENPSPELATTITQIKDQSSRKILCFAQLIEQVINPNNSG